MEGEGAQSARGVKGKEIIIGYSSDVEGNLDFFNG